MTTQVQNPPSQDPNISRLTKVFASVVGGIGAFIAALFIFAASVNVVFAGKAFPGVSIEGIDLSGLDQNQIRERLSSFADYEKTEIIELLYEEQSWAFSPAELGYQFDFSTSTEAAIAVGRKGPIWQMLSEQFQSLRSGVELESRVSIDSKMIFGQLETIASQINQGGEEGQLEIEGLQATGIDGQIGLALNTMDSANAISANLLLRNQEAVTLTIDETIPRILEVSAQAEIANQILSNDLTLNPGGSYADNPDPWIIPREDLASMLSVERVDADSGSFYQIGLNSQQLGALLASWAPELYLEAENPRFIFNDESRQLEVIQAELVGRTLEIDTSIEHINARVAQGQHSIDLQYDLSNPPIRESMTGEELGITELVNAETTYFYGSSSERMQNIQTAAARFHGLLVPPGATFSMVENIGDISLDSGFAEALIIYGDRTIKGVGGGVCQVSTTLFRTVFFSGFPVVERNPHAYRVYYYELNAGGGIDPLAVGLDATVYSPIVDFKFVNDSDHWLLMETYVDIGARSLTWKFYSTSDGRLVEWDSSGVTNVVEAPDPIYEENEELEKGEVDQVDWAADGAKVSITRTVSVGGELLFEDQFNTQYRPWAAVYQYGPNTPGYPPDEKKPVD